MEIRFNDTEENKKFLENESLVYYLVKRTGKTIRDEDYEDLVSVGKIGLIKAIRTYDEKKGSKFSTYASICINNEIYMHFRKEKKKNRCISLEETINVDSRGRELKIADTIEAPNIPIQDIIEENETLEKIINILINILNKDERTIILYRVSGKTQKEIAKIYNLSQSYISRKIKNIIKKIKFYNSKDSTYNGKYKVEISEEFYKLSINEYKEGNNEFWNFLCELKEEQKIKIKNASKENKQIVIIISTLNSDALISIIEIVNLFEKN